MRRPAGLGGVGEDRPSPFGEAEERGAGLRTEGGHGRQDDEPIVPVFKEAILDLPLAQHVHREAELPEGGIEQDEIEGVPVVLGQGQGGVGVEEGYLRTRCLELLRLWQPAGEDPVGLLGLPPEFPVLPEPPDEPRGLVDESGVDLLEHAVLGQAGRDDPGREGLAVPGIGSGEAHGAPHDVLHEAVGVGLVLLVELQGIHVFVADFDLRRHPPDVVPGEDRLPGDGVEVVALVGGDDRRLRLGRPDATDAEVFEAARRANVSEFADALPDGYDTVVGERGMQLSGGQRQRVAIARALLKDAPVLILDEATSHLDAVNEAEVRAALDRLMAGRTTLVIAHRLSTIRNADRIVVLDAGRVMEQGTHAELLALDGLYSHLIAAQLMARGISTAPPVAAGDGGA
ncbi:MAG: ATP-binding cassette domain-containing protein [Firmicutes bacterium]|nr:ATP-binding cassette domain-containing protein [Bacillota bacterium]